ncbi:MAG: hypothetical protein IRZ16_02570 [Myxococcaceae bacterium]|nr:hypothetical protein [Myxococcaceae bacterium]
MKRFPLRTLLLMILALVLFVRLWCTTHPGKEASLRSGVVDVTLHGPPDAGAARDGE